MPEGNIVSVTGTTVVFVFALVLALVVERLLELLKAAYDVFDSRRDLHRFWTRRARWIAGRLEGRLKLQSGAAEEASVAVLTRADEMLDRTAKRARRSIPVVSGDLVRRVTVRSVLKLAGIGIGVVLCWSLGLNVGELATDTLRGPVGETLTGAAIGLGAGPLHKLITLIERAQKTRANKAEVGHA